jgi:hypothetical protein
MMESEFQMSMMGELTFFLGIQVKQMKQGTFMHQAKYTKYLMKKFNMVEQGWNGGDGWIPPDDVPCHARIY